MFQKRIGQIAAIFMLLSVSAQPIFSHADEQLQPAGVTEAAPSSLLKGMSLLDLRKETKAKLSVSQKWVKEKTPGQNHQTSSQSKSMGPIKTLEVKIDRLQDRVKPAGRSIKTSIRNKIPTQGLLQLGGVKMSVFGLMLMMAFGIVLFLMGAAKPTSRLGGRH